MRGLALTVLLVISMSASVLASGSYDYDDLFGKPMPSPESVLCRQADVMEKAPEGWWMIWQNVSDEEYFAFSRYLYANGFSLISWDSHSGILECVIEGESSDIRLTLVYARSDHSVRLLYPEGTRPEDIPGKSGEKETRGILPAIPDAFSARRMPNLENPLQKQADIVETLEDGSVRMVFHGFGRTEFDISNSYLSQKGCAIDKQEQSGDGTILSVVWSLGDHSFGYSYDSVRKQMSVTYPPDSAPEAYVPAEPGVTGPVTESHTVGGVVSFGHYEQDNILSNGDESLEWIILARRGSAALLLSRRAIDARPFHDDQTPAAWSECALRTWLNDTFLHASFSADEQAAILKTEVDNGPEQGLEEWNPVGGRTTEDRIFLLSYHEAFELYLNSDENRVCPLSVYASACGAYGWWWLRSPGELPLFAAAVDGSGAVNEYGVFSVGAVRPVCWVDLDSGAF